MGALLLGERHSGIAYRASFAKWLVNMNLVSKMR